MHDVFLNDYFVLEERTVLVRLDDKNMFAILAFYGTGALDANGAQVFATVERASSYLHFPSLNSFHDLPCRFADSARP